VCVTASCTFASHTAATGRASDSKVRSAETDIEVVKSNKWFVMSVVCLAFAGMLHLEVTLVCECSAFRYWDCMFCEIDAEGFTLYSGIVLQFDIKVIIY